MASQSTCRRGGLISLRAGLFVLLLLSCAHRPATAPPSSPPEDAVITAPDGSQYTIARVPKIEGEYVWVDQDTVRILPFGQYEVVRHDEAFFYVKMYQGPEQAVSGRRELGEPFEPGPLPEPSARFVLEELEGGLPRRGQWREGFALADIDGDGLIDLVLGPARKGGGVPAIFRNQGGGALHRWRDARFPYALDYGDVAVADFNGDGAADIAFGIHLAGVTIMLGDGKGHFAPAPGMEVDVAEGFSSRAVAAADWDGDGRPDLIALSEATRRPSSVPPGLRVYLNHPEGWKAIMSEDREPAGDRVVVGDLDGDGRPDALGTANAIGATRLVRRNQGASWRLEELAPLPERALVDALALGDADRDGRLDVALGYSTGVGGVRQAGIELLLARGDGYERAALAYEQDGARFADLAFGDFDGDGWPDLAAVRRDGSLVLFAGQGHGRFAADATLPAEPWRAGCGGAAVAAADLDGDGQDELVATFAGEPEAFSQACREGGGIQAWRVR